jgi:large subunit ribosomal protein L22
MSRARCARRPKLGSKITTARARFSRVPPRKARAVADLIRGLTVAEADQQLALLHRPSAAPVIRNLLKSAVANARESEALGDRDPEELIIGEIMIDGGPVTKRYRPRAMGRATVIRKRTAHVTINLYTQV